MRIYFASDHAGFELKHSLIAHARGLGHATEDCGAHTVREGDDYVEYVRAAAEKLVADIRAGVESRAVVIGASGQGEAMAANRFKGVRCALYYGEGREQRDADDHILGILASARAHNDANALSMGARFITEDEAKRALVLWLETPFSGEERHRRRNAALDGLG